MDQDTVGMIKLWPAEFQPQYWRYCNGQSLAVSSFDVLYYAIGNTYGGDSTNLALPNLNSSLPFPGGKHPVYIMCVEGSFPGRNEQDEYLGVVKLYAGTDAHPLSDYTYCDGQSLSVNNNQALFSLLEYTYGGSGLNFNLPNLNEKPPFPQYPQIKYVICTSGIYPSRS